MRTTCCHHRPRRQRSVRREMAGWLFRWGFTALAVLAAVHNMLGAALVTGLLAWAGWQAHKADRRRWHR